MHVVKNEKLFFGVYILAAETQFLEVLSQLTALKLGKQVHMSLYELVATITALVSLLWFLI